MGRAAAARIDLIDIGRIVLFTADLVVVPQLITGRDIARRVDENAAMLDDGLAIAFALVIDEARIVAVDGGIDDRVLVDDEQECVIVVDVVIVITRVSRLMRKPFAQVFDDARALGNKRRREHAASVHRRIAYFDERRTHHWRTTALRLRLIVRNLLQLAVHTATGALMAG